MIEFFKEKAIFKEQNVSSEKTEKIISTEKLTFDDNDIIENIQKALNEEIIAPRSNGIINFKFTPRVFPTPSRESQDKQEKDVSNLIL